MQQTNTNNGRKSEIPFQHTSRGKLICYVSLASLTAVAITKHENEAEYE